MASSSNTKTAYDAFLSFRGADLRKNFVGHLYQALNREGIHTFRDNEELKKGDQISPVLMKAIEESCIAIIVFSDDYASSRWCLEEVAKIMECKEAKNLTVLPVFYKVDPREVREGRNSYRRALNKHESKLGENSEKVTRWKKALSAAGNLSGWHLNDGDESELIQEIVKFISTQLRRTPLHVADYPVGIDSQVVKLRGMLNLESTDAVLMMGLWGKGGIGKTTLAKAIYNDIFRLFEGSSFLARVRENSKDYKDLVALQERLLNDILLPENRLEVSNVDGGKNLIQQRLGRKRVLVVLDDVDYLHQLCALAGKDKWFGDGSRIIVTTRDSHLLTSHEIDQDHVYEVTTLNDNEARELLSKCAFPPYQKLEIRTDLVNGVLNHARGLPLALEVLGSLLRNRGEDEWDSTLRRLSKFPNETINNVLKISYIGLEEDHKEIFLHIACFFKGWKIGHICEVLNSCDFEATIGLKVLSERSLIKIESEALEMHDLIQSMGMNIVKQKCDDLRRRSRLWSYEDVVDVLRSDMGDCDVKAIVLNPPVPVKISVSRDAFTKLRSLRLLILRNVSFQGPICLPNWIRWFEWPGAPWIPEFASGPQKLVGLDLSKGKMTIVPKPLEEFRQLKYINFSSCNSLVHMPDISCAPNLEKLDFSKCKNLVGAHESISLFEFRQLKYINFSYCNSLVHMPSISCAPNLEELDFHGCINLVGAHESISLFEFRQLKYINFSSCNSLVHMPHISCAPNLEKLDFSKCKNLVGAHESISLFEFRQLKYINFSDCNSLVHMPDISCAPNLEELDFHGCRNLVGAHESISLFEFRQLKYINFSSCNSLVHLPDISCAPDLEKLDFSKCRNLVGAHKSISLFEFRQLTYINFSECNSLVHTPDISCAPNLTKLDFFACINLVGAHESIANHDKLKRLRLAYCSKLRSLTKELKSKNLYLLYLLDCNKFERFPDIPHELKRLRAVNLNGTAIKELPASIGNLVSLNSLLLNGCSNLVGLPSNIYKLQNLRELGLAGCENLAGFPKLEDSADPCIEGKLSKLQRIYISGSDLCMTYVLGNLSRFPSLIDLHPYVSDITSLPTSLKERDGLTYSEVLNYYESLRESGESNSEVKSSFMYEDSLIRTDLEEDLQDCPIITEEESQMVPKKTYEACKPRPRGLLTRLAKMSGSVGRCFGC